MKIAIIGATGFVGSKVVAEALTRGHQVVALCRDFSKLPTHTNIKPALLDITDSDSIALAIEGCNAVVHAFAAPRSESVEERVAKQTEGTKSIIEAVKKAGIKRLVAVGGAGTAEVAPGVKLMDSYFFPPAYLGGAKSTAVIKELLSKESAIDWVFVSPPNFLEEGERTGKYRTGTDNLIIELETGRSYMSTNDYAVALLDEIEVPKHHNVRFTVGN